MQNVLDNVVEGLGQDPLRRDEIYFHLLALYHEYMHSEAIAYTRQTHGHPPPRLTALPERPIETIGTAGMTGDVDIPGGVFMLGASRNLLFVFDNEKWAHPVEVAPFRIARTQVTEGEFAAFVDDGGYKDDRWWSAAGLIWRNGVEARCPVYWSREANGRWLKRAFDKLVPIEPRLPVIHVSWYEAEAYCNWAGRRLPTEVEWEVASAAEPGDDGTLSTRHRRFPWGDETPTPDRANLDWTRRGCIDVGALPESDSAFGCRQMIGNAWEWTASDFLPYPGFVVDPYKEYSQPWFGDHKVLRGGCWTTRSHLIRNTWRNFYTPDRRDVWAGFRTCARSGQG
jgi:iron(II)-dependent oxidoreductase